MFRDRGRDGVQPTPFEKESGEQVAGQSLPGDGSSMPMQSGTQGEWMTRFHVSVGGRVQGVGFRPFVYRLATGLGLVGWIKNDGEGVELEVEGGPGLLDAFVQRLRREAPPRSAVEKVEITKMPSEGGTTFEILNSETRGPKTARVLPDLSLCQHCLQEIFDRNNRRYLYPFTNCTHCGPRYSIIESLPYDRERTTMKKFTMCPDCRREYEDPLNRRFHAQPNACPACGPRVELWDGSGECLARSGDAIAQAVQALAMGLIVAVKGVGGFHLMLNAQNDEALRELRFRKRRPDKPLAVMFPSMESIREQCEVSPAEEKLLLSPESPIVLLRRRIGPVREMLSDGVAPGNPYLGAFLPYSPLHAVLLQAVNFPLIATSGNISDEPICTDEREALVRLHYVADLFLVHDRPIYRAMDDSIVQMLMGEPRVLRAARGYAPCSVSLGRPLPPVLAVGGHLKNTVAVTSGDSIVVSQHIGDLDTLESLGSFRRADENLRRLYEVEPAVVAGDLHPDYASTQYGRGLGKPFMPVQHHHAHVAAVIAEHGLEGEVLGVCWDGTGFGPDGTVWGGEFLLATDKDFQRAAAFRSFKLPGGEKAVREPRRSAMGALYEFFGEDLFRLGIPTVRSYTRGEWPLIRTMLIKSVNSPTTSSVGRLFDAVASIIGLRQRATFEGQAAMDLEFAADPGCEEIYPFQLGPEKDGPARIDWGPMICEVLNDFSSGVPAGIISARFHNTLAETIVAVARSVGERRVVLSGGCFQNRVLLERAAYRLEEEGFWIYWSRRVPTNDGGLSLGQAAVAARRWEKDPKCV